MKRHLPKDLSTGGSPRALAASPKFPKLCVDCQHLHTTRDDDGPTHFCKLVMSKPDVVTGYWRYGNACDEREGLRNKREYRYARAKPCGPRGIHWKLAAGRESKFVAMGDALKREIERVDRECREFLRDLRNPEKLNRAHRKLLRNWICSQKE